MTREEHLETVQNTQILQPHNQIPAIFCHSQHTPKQEQTVRTYLHPFSAYRFKRAVSKQLGPSCPAQVLPIRN